MTTPLSPAAQVVLDAFESSKFADQFALAAALRAVADQILIRPEIPSGEYSTLMRIIDGQFRAIADELEGQP
jgi:hypothetical protein